MSATAIRYLKETNDTWKVSILPGESSAIEPLLDLAILHASVRGAYVYRFDREKMRALLAAFSGPAPEPANQTGAIGLRGRAAMLHWNRRTPLVLADSAAADWRFAGFPEFQGDRFQGVVSIPLLDAGEVAGLANFCRPADMPLSANSLSFLISLSLPLGTLLTASVLREQLQEVHQELADRKLLDRAKGLLQARYQYTEEEAYFQLRRLSRRQRVPMRDIALRVIESGAEPFREALAQHD